MPTPAKVNALERSFSNFAPFRRVMGGMKPTRSSRSIKGAASSRSAASAPAKSGGALRLLSRFAVFAPVALELVSHLRGQQKARRGKYYKASSKGKAFDFILDQAQRRYGKGKRKKGWF